MYNSWVSYEFIKLYGFFYKLRDKLAAITFYYAIFSILFVLEYLLQFQEGLKYYIKYIILSRHCQMLH